MDTTIIIVSVVVVVIIIVRVIIIIFLLLLLCLLLFLLPLALKAISSIVSAHVRRLFLMIIDYNYSQYARVCKCLCCV